MPRWTRRGRPGFWEDLGADAITLESFSINRNFHRLADRRQAVKFRLIEKLSSVMASAPRSFPEAGPPRRCPPGHKSPTLTLNSGNGV